MSFPRTEVLGVPIEAEFHELSFGKSPTLPGSKYYTEKTKLSQRHFPWLVVLGNTLETEA